MALDDQQLFLRFRRDGDVGALGELFDRTAPALLRVALHLTRDPAAAEDLVQATFLRAIEARADWDGVRPLLPWLCGILQNRARQARWQTGRVPDPLRLPAAPPADPAQAAERAEFDAAVDAAIAGLPEIYRAPLRLHLAYGHEPAEIAHALERPPGTVRSQLARGLDLLRKVLPAGFAGGTALLLASGRGLAAVKQAVLAHSAAAVPAAAAATVIGGLLMKKVVAAGLAAVLAAGAWLAWPEAEAVLAPHGSADTPRKPVQAAVHAPATEAAAATALANERLEVPAAATTGSLRVRCQWGDDGSPAAGVTVHVKTMGPGDRALLARAIVMGGDGSALVADLPRGSTWLAADRGGSLRTEVVAGATTDAELTIPAGLAVRGRVVDEHGSALPGARIWLSKGRRNHCDGEFATTSDLAGEFFLRAVEAERFVSATLAGRRSAVARPVRGETRGTVSVELVLRGPGASIVGRVLAPRGTPVSDARVYVGRREHLSSWDEETFAEHRPPLEVRTEVDGTFAVHGLPPSVEQAVWVRAPGCCVWHEVVEVAAEGDTVLAVQLQVGAALTGRATDASGKPIAGVWLEHRSSAWFHLRGDFFEDRWPDWVHYTVVTGADGRYRMDNITPGTVRVLARKDRLEVRGDVPVTAGETATWHPVLAEVAIRGRVVDERGAPMLGVSVSADPPRNTGNLGWAKADADGCFACSTLAPVPHVLTFHVHGDQLRVRPAAKLFGILPGGDEVLVRLLDANVPSAVITGRLLDRDGRPPQQASVSCATSGSRSAPAAEVDAKGEFRIGPLPPGTFRLQGIVGEGSACRRSPWGEPFVLTARQEIDVGVVQMPETGSIRVTATGPDGALLDGNPVAIEDDTSGRTPWHAGQLERGQLLIENVAPGSHRVKIFGERVLPGVYHAVDVTAGHTTTADIVVPKGVGVRLVVAPVSEPVPIHLSFEWTRDGVLHERFENRCEAHVERNWDLRLLPGSWEIVITSETGKTAANHFVLGAGDADGRVIPIRMP